jgi:phage/plasmid-associated DNA primase
MVILPFTRSVSPHLADLTLLDKLIEEKDEIISYCLRALSHVIANNMQFSPCAVADQMKAEWRNAAIDPRSFEEFWYTQIAVTGDFENSVFAMEMYDRYKAFCLENQYEPIPYLNMRNWIAANVSTDDCIPKRIHRTNENPKAGYCGIYFTEKK